MYRKLFLSVTLMSALICISSCRQHYELTDINRSRILIDGGYKSDSDADAFLVPYKHLVDSIMSPVVGSVAKDMMARRPESALSNLLSDILVWGGKDYNEHPDFAVYNMGGIRASFSKGQISYGDIVDVAPFENKICFLTFSGEKVMQLFSEIAAVGGEGVSHGVNLVISKNGKLIDAKLNGKEIVPTGVYRVATLDYLAQGNDNMDAFRKGTDVVSPQNKENNIRYIITEYFKSQTVGGIVVDRDKEGRIVIK